MTDETKPKRLRGAKLLEQGYRAGYRDGMRDTITEIEARTAMDTIREERIQTGLAKFRSQKTSEPRRTRKRRNGLDAGGPASSVADPT